MRVPVYIFLLCCGCGLRALAQPWAPPGETPFSFESGHLPLVLIHTDGQWIQDDPKVPVGFEIIDNGPGQLNHPDDTPVFKGRAGVEYRGSSSQQFPKKGLGIEIWDEQDASIDTALLGMPAESDWILNASYSDKTFCRNPLAYQLSRELGHYGSRYRHVELFIDGEYQGIYIFSEKIKRSKHRVDISKLSPDENTGDDVSGGYIFKIDKSTGSGGGEGWVSNYLPFENSWQTILFQYDYPKADEISPAQRTYIRDYVDSFETALQGPDFTDPELGYAHYIDVPSFIDYFFVNEMSKNVDGYRLSTYLYKDKNSQGGKLHIGPVWDYDIAWYNANYCAGESPEGWAYQFPCDGDFWQLPFWWKRLMEDPAFTSAIKCRWEELRLSTLSDTHCHAIIDSLAAELEEAQVRNFTTWPILGVWIWPNPAIADTYAGEIGNLKDWIADRYAWLDEHMPGTCKVSAAQEWTPSANVRLHPNPAKGYFQVELDIPQASAPLELILTDLSGRQHRVWQGTAAAQGLQTFSVSVDLPPGLYIAAIYAKGQALGHKQKLLLQ